MGASRGRRRSCSRSWVVVGCLVALVGAACTGTDADDDAGGSGGTADPDGPVTAEGIDIVNTEAWRMHHIDGRFRGANALGAADVDGEGHRD